MNEQSAFIINEESHEKIVKENEWVLYIHTFYYYHKCSINFELKI